MTKSEYENDRRVYKEYLAMKDRHDDMHGVSDAANDIRELDARWKGTVEGRGSPPQLKIALEECRHASQPENPGFCYKCGVPLIKVSV